MMEWPPFQIEKVTYFNYVLDADMGALTKLCDAFFGTPSGGAVRIQPLIPQVIFSYANIEKATSSDPKAGSTPEKDILLWTPVVQLTPDGALVTGVPVFSPFVFVNNATAVSAGRELFGFPKNWCEIVSAPEGPTSKASTLVKAYSLPPGEEVLAPRRVLELKCTGGGGEPTWLFELEEIVSEIARVIGSFCKNEDGFGPVKNLEAIALATASLLQRKQSFAFLKQFPSMSVPNECCYQGIGMMDTTLGKIERFGALPSTFELEYVDDYFHDFSGSFGWKPGVPVPVRAAFYMDFSFTIEAGRVIWEAKR